MLFILGCAVALGGDFAQLHLEFAEIAAGRTEAVFEASATNVREIGGVFGGFFLRAHIVNALLGVLHALVEVTAQTLLFFERDFLFFATRATAIGFGAQRGDIGLKRGPISYDSLTTGAVVDTPLPGVRVSFNYATNAKINFDTTRDIYNQPLPPGKGVSKDEVESVKWFRKAADQGDATAQFNLGSMYANGQGTAQDYAQALRWYQAAAGQAPTAAPALESAPAVAPVSGTAAPADLRRAA
mgnify:CR=1 FL=1